MIIAYHSIFSMYGFWLPNDPRGSGSDFVANWELFRYGSATKTDSRQSVARWPMPPGWKREAAAALARSPVTITGRQALAISRGFAAAAGEGPYPLYACAILPDHVHLVIGASERSIRQVVGHFKSRATRQLREQHLWHDHRPPWGEHGWNVYLESIAAVERAIRYVDNNPLKEGKKPQHWSFVAAFVPRAAIAQAASSEAARDKAPPRRIGGAALRSRTEAHRKRRGESGNR